MAGLYATDCTRVVPFQVCLTHLKLFQAGVYLVLYDGSIIRRNYTYHGLT
jgi:hypothetical protein